MFDKDDDDYLEYLYLMGDEDDKEELETWFGKAGAKQIVEENTGHKRASDEEDDYEPVGCLMSIFPALLLVIFIALWIGLCVAGEKLIAFSNEHRNPYEGYKDDYNLIAKNYDNVFVSKPTISARSRKTFGYDVPNKRTYFFNNDGIYKLEMTVQQGKDDIDAIYRLINMTTMIILICIQSKRK